MNGYVQEKQENIATGIVGALLGACIGMALIIVLSRIGFFASIAGFVMAVCTLKGYELLGGKLSKTGVIICVVIMIIMTWLADYIDWAIVIMQEYNAYGYGLGIFDVFQYVFPVIVDSGSIGSYILNLLLLYLFTVLGAFATTRNTLKALKDKEAQQNQNYQGQAYQNPSYQDSSYQNQAYQNPNYQDPNYQNQTYQNPTGQAQPGQNVSGGYADSTVNQQFAGQGAAGDAGEDVVAFCTECGQKLKLTAAGHKGNLSITCPKCGNTFIYKTHD